MLTDKELERYSRQIVLEDIGEDGQLKLKKSRVCIVGLGGLGWLTCLQLAAMGVGYLRLVDRDIVELSNLQRQLIYDTDDLNKPKTEAAANKIRRINPDIAVDPVMTSLSLQNIGEVLRDVDVAVDCLDNFKARRILNYGCVRSNIPLIYSSAIKLYGAVHTILPEKSACLECLYSDIETLEAESCAQIGVLPTILGAVSSVTSQEVVNLLLSKPPLLSDHLLVISFTSMDFDKIPLTRNVKCKICGSDKIVLAPLEGISVESLCAEGAFMITQAKPSRLDLERIKTGLKKIYPVNKFTPVYLELTYREDVAVTIVRNGSFLIKGVKTPEAAREIYFNIMGKIACFS